ncbi:MAG TPA: pitrilysin family protein [Burkholderiaceae bacterium]|nr:pitrilysin family protein [Burkholderiaceae bacterium]
MKRWFLTAGALLVAPVLGAQSNEIGVQSKKLANGLEVMVIENHAVPIVTIELDVKNGAYTEGPEFSGLSHLYEHMFFKANKTIPSQEKYLRRLNQLGAQWNGTTSEERVNYFITVGVDSLVPALQFMEDAIRYPLFNQDELVRERPVVLGEFDRNEANPFFHLTRGADTILWSPGFYTRKTAIGKREVITSATREKMNTIKERFYIPNNSALILAGDITPARGFQLAEQIFGDWPRGPNPFATPAPNPPPLTKSAAVIVEQPVNGAALYIAWQGPSVTADPAATYAADVLSTVLSNPSSTFQKRLVDSGLTFGVGLSYYTQAHVGPITVFAQTTPDKALQAQKAIMEEIVKLGDENYVTQAELAAAQRQLGIQALYGREQSSGYAHTVGFWWAVTGLDYYKTYVPEMQKVTRANLAGFARKYIIGKPRVTGLLLSPADRAKLNVTTAQLMQNGGAE